MLPHAFEKNHLKHLDGANFVFEFVYFLTVSVVAR